MDTKVHTKFREAVEGIEIDGYYVRTEVNYRHGTDFKTTSVRGECRIDAAIYDADNNIVKIFDLKTGSAKLNQRQINHIRKNVNSPAPIEEIKVE